MKSGVFSLLKLLVVSVLLIMASGCADEAKILAEKEDKRYKQGVRYVRDGKYDKGMVSFLKVIEDRKYAPESHLELGRLYLERMEDPLAAIYHFKKFLEVKPQVDESPMVRQLIETAKKAFARTLPGRSYEEDMTRVDLMHSIENLRRENVELKRQLARAHSGVKEEKVKERDSIELVRSLNERKVSVPKRYTVVGGDTLSKISQKVYGTSANWEKIYKANVDVIPSPHALKVGSVLTVPQ